MSDRKHGEKSNETKAVRPKREEGQQPGKKPAEALSRLSANMARPEDIKALQRTVGNRIVQRLITKQSLPGALQRHVPPETDAAYTEHFPGIQDDLRAMKPKVKGLPELRSSMAVHHNALLDAAFVSADYKEGGGESQSPQTGGESQSPQGGEAQSPAPGGESHAPQTGGESQGPVESEEIEEGSTTSPSQSTVIMGP